MITHKFEEAYEALATSKGKLFQQVGIDLDTYVVAETPRKAREELIEHLGITLEEISLTDANLKFLDLQRSRKDSHATATT